VPELTTMEMMRRIVRFCKTGLSEMAISWSFHSYYSFFDFGILYMYRFPHSVR